MSNKKIIDIQYDENRCFESYPCKHNVIITYDDNSREECMSNGTIIVSIYKSLHRPIPDHFKHYEKKGN